MSDRIRICFVSLMFSPIVGGSEKQAEKQARQLQAFGHDVTIVTLRAERRWEKFEVLEGLPVVRVGGIFGPGGQLRMGRLGHFPIDMNMFLKLWYLRHSYDIIHVLQVSPLAGVAAFVGKITKKPVIINVQSAGPYGAQLVQLEREISLMADTLTNTAFLKIDPSKKWIIGGGDVDFLITSAIGGQVIVNFLRKSKAFYQVLSSRSSSYLTSHGFRLEQIRRIPNGVDTEKFRPLLEQFHDPVRPERDILCVARLEYAKGIDVLLHAWARMMHRYSEIKNSLQPILHLVGDGRLRKQLERMATELGIQDSVRFHGNRGDIDLLLQKSWGFVLPSRWEGMPNALLEAMSVGLPCVASRVSGSEDIIADGVNGLLVEPEQPIELSQALNRIIVDPELAQRLGHAARKTILHDYQLINVVKQLVELYRHLLTKEQALVLKSRGKRSHG